MFLRLKFQKLNVRFFSEMLADTLAPFYEHAPLETKFGIKIFIRSSLAKRRIEIEELR